MEGEADKIEGDDGRSGLWMVDRMMPHIKELGSEQQAQSGVSISKICTSTGGHGSKYSLYILVYLCFQLQLTNFKHWPSG